MITRHDRMKQREEEELMRPLPTTIPKFATEAEEAEWWDQHQDGLAARFQQTADADTLGRGTVARRAAEPTPAAEPPAPPRRRRRGRPAGAVQAATKPPKPEEPSTNPFLIARDAAAIRLQQAHGEKHAADARLALLAVEIPSLQTTIAALDNLLNPKPVSILHRMSDPAVAMRAAKLEEGHSVSAGVPDVIDDFAGMASIPNPVPTHSNDGQELAPDVDSLPGIGGIDGIR